MLSVTGSRERLAATYLMGDVLSMSNESPNSFSNDPRLNQIIARYLEAFESGDAPDRGQLLSNHPDLAESLSAFFSEHDRLRKVADATSDALSETPTIAPTAGASEEHTVPPSADAGSTEDVTIAPRSATDGKRMVTGWRDRSLSIWDAETGAPLVRLSTHPDAVSKVAFSADGRRIISFSSQGIQLWDALRVSRCRCCPRLIWSVIGGIPATEAFAPSKPTGPPVSGEPNLA